LLENEASLFASGSRAVTHKTEPSSGGRLGATAGSDLTDTGTGSTPRFTTGGGDGLRRRSDGNRRVPFGSGKVRVWGDEHPVIVVKARVSAIVQARELRNRGCIVIRGAFIGGVVRDFGQKRVDAAD
jgi:hypothetical protein